MDLVTKGLQPAGPLKFFEELSAIPRGSGNEKQAADYIENFGKQLGLETYRDEKHNVIIKKPATAGYENADPVMLQGHSDMVCEKNGNTVHDFEKDPIKLVLSEDKKVLRAAGTTLGADNGTAVAIMMDILQRDDLAHPALECVFTSMEEIGLFGAMALDYSKLSATRMINMDCGPEDTVLVSSAGAKQTLYTRKVTFEEAAGDAVSFKVRGLQGGHSGGCIHMERANSIKLLGRGLSAVLEQMPVKLAQVDGGLKANAIPREAEAVFCVPAGMGQKAAEILAAELVAVKRQFAKADPGANFEARPVSLPAQVMTEADSNALVWLLCGLRNGVYTYSLDIAGLVLCSGNTGVLKQNGNEVSVEMCLRSADPDALDALVRELGGVVRLAGFDTDFTADFPAWDLVSESALREATCELYKECYGKDMKVEAVHGGLECGVIYRNMPGIDIVALGCDADGAHTPEECLYLESFDRFYTFVCKLLEKLA